MEEHHVAHASVSSGIGKIITGRRDKKNVGAFLVDWHIHADAGAILDVVRQKLQHVLDAARLNAQVVPGPEAVGRGLQHPVDAAADQVEQFAADHGNFRLIDPVGAEHRAAAALRALVKVVKPFLEYIDRQVARARERPEAHPRLCEVAAVNGPDQLGAQDRHVFRIAGADVEMALVRAGAAAHADVHKQAEGAVFFEPLFHAVKNDLSPVFRKLPIGVGWLPGPRIGHVQGRQILCGGSVAPRSRTEIDRSFHPGGGRRLVSDLHQFFRFGNFRERHGYSFSTGRPAAFILSRNSSSYSL